MDINELLSSLSPDDMEKLKETAASMLGKGDESDKVSSLLDSFRGSESASSKHDDDNMGSDAQMVSALISKIGAGNAMPQLLKAVSALENTKNIKDARSDFLFALKPLLKKQRHSKVDEAVKIMRLFSILPILKSDDRY